MCTFSDNTISIDAPVSVSPISRYTPNAQRHNRLFCGYECAPHVCVCESVPLVAYFYCYSNCIITHMTFSNSAIQKFWQISLYCYEDVRENKIKQQHQQRQQQRQQKKKTTHREEEEEEEYGLPSPLHIRSHRMLSLPSI